MQRRSRVRAVIVLIVLAALCCLLVVTAFFTRRIWRPLLADAGILGPTLTATGEVSTPVEVIPSGTPEVTLTITPVTLTPASLATSTAKKPAETPTSSVTAGKPAAGNIFQDDFSADPATNWTISGDVKPTPDQAGAPRTLIFTSAETPASILLKTPIALVAGQSFEFQIQVDATRPENAMHFRWFAGKEPPADGTANGVINLDIVNGKRAFIFVRGDQFQVSCPLKDFNDSNPHTYTITVEKDFTVLLMADNEVLCKGTDQILHSAKDEGLIYFYGIGKLSQVKVTGPKQ